MSKLSKFYRNPKLYISLPSGKNFYSNDVLEYANEDSEVGILPMTAHEELLFKNPDALLNGSAVDVVLKMCAGVKLPNEMLAGDVDVILAAIRVASYGDKVDITYTCPNNECKHANDLMLPLSNALQSFKPLSKLNVVNTDSGLTIFINPPTLAQSKLKLKADFEAKKMIKSISNEVDEEVKLNIFSNSFNIIAQNNIRMLVQSVSKIIKEDEEIEVTDKQEIADFLENSEISIISKIDKKLEDISNYGINNKFKVKCSKCETEWEEEYDFNLSSFFTNS
jgi:hypothetical protein